MKTFQEIMNSPRISNIEEGMDGFKAIYTVYNFQGSIICSKGAGWEHVSVSPFKKRYIPTWEDMCYLKDICFNEDEAVIQIHPPKNQYVNNSVNCLHLWRCYYKDMILPPSCLIGVRQGQTYTSLEEELKEAYKLAGEVLE